MSNALAIDGGQPTVAAGMVHSWPVITDDDKQAVLAVLDSDHLHGANAPNAVGLQREWAEFCGAKHCLVSNSGTSALHIALAAAGVQPGDEVITTAFTFWATAAAILHHNAIPVFVDIELDTFSIDPTQIEDKITENTTAIMPVHIHGMPVDLDPILEIGRKHGLKVVDDACQAHGAEYKGKRVGALCHGTGFSLNRSKNLTAAEGGLYTTNDDEAFEYAKKVQQFGEIIIPGQDREYNAYTLGWNYRATEFCNAFARSQLQRLAEYNEIRIQMADYLTTQLKEVPGVAGPYTPADRKPVYFSYIVEFRPEEVGVDLDARTFRARAEKVLRAEGVGLGQWQRMPVPAQDVFQQRIGYGRGCPWSCRNSTVTYRPEDYPNTWKFLDSHSYLTGVNAANTMELMELYVDAFHKVFTQADKWAHRDDLA